MNKKYRNSFIDITACTTQQSITNINDFRKMNQEERCSQHTHNQKVSILGKSNSLHSSITRNKEEKQAELIMKKNSEALEEWSKNLQKQQQGLLDEDQIYYNPIQRENFKDPKKQMITPNIKTNIINIIDRDDQHEILNKETHVKEDVKVFQLKNRPNTTRSVRPNYANKNFVTIGTLVQDQSVVKTFEQQKQDWNVQVMSTLFMSKFNQKLEKNEAHNKEINHTQVNTLVQSQVEEIVQGSFQNFKAVDVYAKALLGSLFNVPEIVSYVMDQDKVKQNETKLKSIWIQKEQDDVQENHGRERALMETYLDVKQQMKKLKNFYSELLDSSKVLATEHHHYEQKIKLLQYHCNKKIDAIISEMTNTSQKKFQFDNDPETKMDYEYKTGLLVSDLNYEVGILQRWMSATQITINGNKSQLETILPEINRLRSMKNQYQYTLRDYYLYLLQSDYQTLNQSIIQILNCLISIGEDITTVIFPQYIGQDFIELILRLAEIEREENLIFHRFEHFLKEGNQNNFTMSDVHQIWNHSMSQQFIKDKYLAAFDQNYTQIDKVIFSNTTGQNFEVNVLPVDISKNQQVFNLELSPDPLDQIKAQNINNKLISDERWEKYHEFEQKFTNFENQIIDIKNELIKKAFNQFSHMQVPNKDTQIKYESIFYGLFGKNQAEKMLLLVDKLVSTHRKEIEEKHTFTFKKNNKSLEPKSQIVFEFSKKSSQQSNSGKTSDEIDWEKKFGLQMTRENHDETMKQQKLKEEEEKRLLQANTQKKTDNIFTEQFNEIIQHNEIKNKPKTTIAIDENFSLKSPRNKKLISPQKLSLDEKIEQNSARRDGSIKSVNLLSPRIIQQFEHLQEDLLQKDINSKQLILDLNSPQFIESQINDLRPSTSANSSRGFSELFKDKCSPPSSQQSLRVQFQKFEHSTALTSRTETSRMNLDSARAQMDVSPQGSLHQNSNNYNFSILK